MSNGPDHNMMQSIEATRLQLTHTLLDQQPDISTPDLNQTTQRLLSHALFDRVCQQQPTQIPTASPTPQEQLATNCLNQNLTNNHNIPANILERTYAHSLTHPLTPTPDGRIDINNSRKTTKAQGIFYTPTHVVDHIVERTIDPLTTNGVSSLPRIVDPACGCGAFLVGAYRRLLAIHSHPDDLYQRKRLLLDCIHGVDLDPVAVEIARYSLNLTLLDAHTDRPIKQLPDLSANIRVGNAIIGTDYPNPRDNLTPFDWTASFPHIFFNDSTGFDAVIGNPPYVSFGLRGTGTINKRLAQYIRNNYPNSAEYKLSIYAIFLDKAVQLARTGGRIGFILPDSFLLGRYFSKLRRFLLDNCRIDEITLHQSDFWPKAAVGRPTVILLEKTTTPPHNVNVTARLLPRNTNDPIRSFAYPQSYFDGLPHNRFRLLFDKESFDLVNKMEAIGRPASDFISIHTGIRSRIGQKRIVSTEPHGPTWHPGLISGRQIDRYSHPSPQNYINIDPALLWSGGWDTKIVNAAQKLLIRQTGDSIIATLDTTGLYHLNNIHAAVLKNPTYDVRYILALLNSRLLNHFYRLISLEHGRGMAQTDIETLEKLPIRPIDFTCPSDKTHYNELITLTQQLLDTHAQEHAKSPDVQETNTRINQIVCELYDAPSALHQIGVNKLSNASRLKQK